MLEYYRMKNTLIIIIFFLFKSFSLSASNLEKIEKELVEIGSNNCVNKSHKLFSFPDIYHSQYNFGTCEYAFINNPKKYAKTYYHYLRAFAFFGRLPSPAELNIAEEYYLPSLPSGTITTLKSNIKKSV